MALKLVIGVHLCNRSDFYLIKGLKSETDNRNRVMYDAIKVLDLEDFSVYDISLEECSKLGYRILDFSYINDANLGDDCIVGGQGVVAVNSVLGFAKLGNLWSCDVPIYYKGELVQHKQNRVYNLNFDCYNKLRPSVKFKVDFYIDLIDYTVQCYVCDKQVYGELDLKYEHSNNSYYRYYCIVAIGNNILLPSLSETISDSICTFGNELAVVSLLGDDSYIVPNNVEFVSIHSRGTYNIVTPPNVRSIPGSGKSNIVIPPSVKRVYIENGDAKHSDISFSLSSNVSNAFLRELYSQFVKDVDGLFGRQEILEAFSKLDGISIGFY